MLLHSEDEHQARHEDPAGADAEQPGDDATEEPRGESAPEPSGRQDVTHAWLLGGPDLLRRHELLVERRQVALLLEVLQEGLDVLPELLITLEVGVADLAGLHVQWLLVAGDDAEFVAV